MTLNFGMCLFECFLALHQEPFFLSVQGLSSPYPTRGNLPCPESESLKVNLEQHFLPGVYFEHFEEDFNKEVLEKIPSICKNKHIYHKNLGEKIVGLHFIN